MSLMCSSKSIVIKKDVNVYELRVSSVEFIIFSFNKFIFL